MSDKTYSVYWWDHDPEGWRLEETAPTVIQLRGAIRRLRERGFDDHFSILVASSEYEPW